MPKLNAISLVSYISRLSEPSSTEIVHLFEGLLVKRGLKNYSRVIRRRYSLTPLGVGDRSSRFSSTEEDRNNPKINSHRILYGASNIETAVYEAIVRDRFDISPVGVLYPENYRKFAVVQFLSAGTDLLNLLDLTRGKATHYGVPTDVIRSSDPAHGQHFSKFVYQHMPNTDGFLYSSRFTDGDCVALFHDRAISKLIYESPLVLEKSMLDIPMRSQNIVLD